MGNEANTRGHVKGVAESETNPYTIELNVGNSEKGFVLEIWANTLDVLSVSIVSPSSESILESCKRRRDDQIKLYFGKI